MCRNIVFFILLFADIEIQFTVDSVIEYDLVIWCHTACGIVIWIIKNKYIFQILTGIGTVKCCVFGVDDI